MQKTSLNTLVAMLRICIVIFTLSLISLFLFSFTVNKLNADFFKELGITKTDADKKITNSFLGGYLDAYGAKNAKNIALGNRSQVAKDILVYTRQYVSSDAFKSEYATLKENNKPKENKIKSPEEMRKETIDQYKKSIAETEVSLKKADAGLKPIFEKVLAESKKYLKEAEDPNNKQIASYAKGYPELLKSNQQSYQQELNAWEAQYPANHMLFVKQRLQQFLEETKDIDFTAELTVKNGKRIFVNRNYESKSNRWKMAFRAGKEVVQPAIEFVRQWLLEIK
jgi:DNA-directed RNA polymerase beta' subunit